MPQQTIRFEKIVKSYKLDSSIQEKPIFFNHISKTGGTSLTGGLFSIAVSHGKPYLFIPKQYGDGLKMLPEAWKQSNAMVYCGESRYGFHSNFSKAFNLVTVIRDPVDRVVSGYFWNAKYNNRRDKISIVDFEQSLEKNTNRDLCAKYIFGYQDINEQNAGTILAVCKQHLNDYFAFCSTENIDKLLSFLLSHYASSSIVFNDSKKETDPRKFEFREKFAQDISELNPLDAALYSYVKEQEENFFLQPSQMVNPNTEGVALINKGGKSFDFAKIKIKV